VQQNNSVKALKRKNNKWALRASPQGQQPDASSDVRRLHREVDDLRQEVSKLQIVEQKFEQQFTLSQYPSKDEVEVLSAHYPPWVEEWTNFVKKGQNDEVEAVRRRDWQLFVLRFIALTGHIAIPLFLAWMTYQLVTNGHSAWGFFPAIIAIAYVVYAFLGIGDPKDLPKNLSKSESKKDSKS